MTMGMLDEISFGPFTINIGKRLLQRDNRPVDIGARAFDILAILVSSPHKCVSKNDLLAKIWPDSTVGESSLRFHMSNLRRILKDGVKNTQYIITLRGRGYSFVAPLQHFVNMPIEGEKPTSNLPNLRTSMLGRDRDKANVLRRLLTSRLVTITGLGGVGKTTLALSLAHELTQQFAERVYFIDLGPLNDSERVASTVASVLGLSYESDPLSAIMAHVSPQPTLLVFDTCERVIDAASSLAFDLFMRTHNAYILATSREPLDTKGESIYRLLPLACPPANHVVSASDGHRFPAMQLFIERALATGADLELETADIAIIADICRQLDGVPLAIELAAGRIASFGLSTTSKLLMEKLNLLWPGQRTATQRQKTLQATLDWSYQLLSPLEQIVIRRLEVFAGEFPLDGALSVVTDTEIDATLALQTLDGLVAKSMLMANWSDKQVRYRLLDTTRTYILKLNVCDTTYESERTKTASRHAFFYFQWLATINGELHNVPHLERIDIISGLDNVRAAIEWCFSNSGDLKLGVRFVASGAPLFLSMSLLTECQLWTAEALKVARAEVGNGYLEMQLQSALGVSLMFTHGGKEEARQALTTSLNLAEQYGSADDEFRVLGPLLMFLLRVGDYRSALTHAQRHASLALKLDDPSAKSLAHSLMGVTLHLSGQLSEAKSELEATLCYDLKGSRIAANYLGFDNRLLAASILARNLWLQGFAEDALDRILLTLREAESLNHPLTLSIVLVWAITMAHWTNDLDKGEHYIARLEECASLHSLRPYLAVARGYRGIISARKGNPERGIRELRVYLEELNDTPYQLVSTPLHIALIECFLATGRFMEARCQIDDVIESVKSMGDFCYLPELLRLKGNVHLKLGNVDSGIAIECLDNALGLARRQGAREWEKRVVSDIETLQARH